MPNTYTQLLFHVVFSTKNRHAHVARWPSGASLSLYLGNPQNISRARPNTTARSRCSMNIGDCSAKTAFRTTNDTWREVLRGLRGAPPAAIRR